jgi:3-methylcrotonyl-CoA carboxylase alpha subunit/acetyl-CoA/propionyl-CoA carboxylase biotin carboxyl carrier protein
MVMQKILIANRGEIALRIMRTAAALGIRTVAIHTANDRDALHVAAADDVVEVPSYLDVDAIVAAALSSGAEAIHPGYGFLSERSAFARAIEATQGLALVGPTAEVMDKMGRKDARARSRSLRASRSCPPTPTTLIRPTSPTRSSSRRLPAAAARACGSCELPRSSTQRWPLRSARR